MDWKELVVLKERHDNITNTIEEEFSKLSSTCSHMGPVICAQWRPCKHEDNEYATNKYPMCRWDYCPRLKRA